MSYYAKSAAEEQALVQQGADVAYELGSVTAHVKFANEYLTPDWRQALLSRLTPAHAELYDSYKAVGGQ